MRRRAIKFLRHLSSLAFAATASFRGSLDQECSANRFRSDASIAESSPARSHGVGAADSQMTAFIALHLAPIRQALLQMTGSEQFRDRLLRCAEMIG